MRMTALDVQNHQFPRRFSGYDIDEVEQFRSALVEDWAALTSETEGLRRRVFELETELQQRGKHEQALRDALVTAQGVSDDLRRTAEQEAQTRVGAAEVQAEKILAAAHRQASRLAQDVRELRALRSRMAGSVRATIETHLALLEGFSQDPEDEYDAEGITRLEALAGPAPAGAQASDLPIAAEFTSAPPEGDAESPPAAASDETEPAAEPAPDPMALANGDAADLFGPPGPPEGDRDVPAGGATLAEDTPDADPAEAAPGQTSPPPKRARPAPARARPPSRGWRVFFDQG